MRQEDQLGLGSAAVDAPGDGRRGVGAHEASRQAGGHVERRVGGVVDEVVPAIAGVMDAEVDGEDEEALAGGLDEALGLERAAGAEAEIRFDDSDGLGAQGGWS